MRVRLVPYKLGSASAKEMALGLDVKRIKVNGTRFVPRNDDLLINWGCSASPFNNERGRWINHPNNVSMASDKKTTFRALADAGIPTVPFTFDKTCAAAWFNETDVKVFCRTLTQSKGGKGIVIAEHTDGLVDAPLYTRGICGLDEFRLHVAFGSVFDMAQKRKRQTDADPEAFNPYIRNHDNGWVFVRNDPRTVVSEECKAIAVSAVTALGLHFGAVDLIHDAENNKTYILEVNTAPGITATTKDKYIERFKAYIEEISI